MRSACCPSVPGLLPQGTNSAPKPSTVFSFFQTKSSGNSPCTLSVLSQSFLLPKDNCCALLTLLEMRVCQHKCYKPLHIRQDSCHQRVLGWRDFFFSSNENRRREIKATQSFSLLREVLFLERENIRVQQSCIHVHTRIAPVPYKFPKLLFYQKSDGFEQKCTFSFTK